MSDRMQVKSLRFNKSEVDVTDETDHMKVNSEGCNDSDVNATGVSDFTEMNSSVFSKTEVDVINKSKHVQVYQYKYLHLLQCQPYLGTSFASQLRLAKVSNSPCCAALPRGESTI